MRRGVSRLCANGAVRIMEGKVQRSEEDSQRLNTGGSNIWSRRCDGRNAGGRDGKRSRGGWNSEGTGETDGKEAWVVG